MLHLRPTWVAGRHRWEMGADGQGLPFERLHQPLSGGLSALLQAPMLSCFRDLFCDKEAALIEFIGQRLLGGRVRG